MATILPPPPDNPNRAGVIGSGNDFVAKFAAAPATDVLSEAGAYVPQAAPLAPLVQFVILSNPRVSGSNSLWDVRPVDTPILVPNTTFVTFWPIAGILGIVDDVGVRPARVLSVVGDTVELNYDIAGLDVTGLKCVGVVYVGPQL